MADDLERVPVTSNGVRMKYIIPNVLLACILAINTAWCDSGDQYALLKVGSMFIDKSGANNLTAIGGIYGVGLSPAFTAEGEFSIGLDGGEYAQNKNGNTGDYEIYTLAAYLAYRYVLSESIYAKLKAGLAYENVKNSIVGQGSTVEEGFGAVGGLGLGLVLTLDNKPMMLEFELTRIETDVLFVTLGATYPF